MIGYEKTPENKDEKKERGFYYQIQKVVSNVVRLWDKHVNNLEAEVLRYI